VAALAFALVFLHPWAEVTLQAYDLYLLLDFLSTIPDALRTPVLVLALAGIVLAMFAAREAPLPWLDTAFGLLLLLLIMPFTLLLLWQFEYPASPMFEARYLADWLPVVPYVAALLTVALCFLFHARKTRWMLLPLVAVALLLHFGSQGALGPTLIRVTSREFSGPAPVEPFQPAPYEASDWGEPTVTNDSWFCFALFALAVIYTFLVRKEPARATPLSSAAGRPEGEHP